MATEPDIDTYALKARTLSETPAPEIAYRPPMPQHYNPRIALVGAGGISAAHLAAYRHAGFDVAVICNRTLSKAVARRDEYFPQAEATDDIQHTLTRSDIEVVDLTPHPEARQPMIETALRAGKHVLSQKPFVVDLDAGARLADLADAQGVKLAVNQNGRWAPHKAWVREAVLQGHIGALHVIDNTIHWDHNWVKGTAFEDIHDLILFDFAVHRFDFVTSLIGASATSVFAVAGHAVAQDIRPPLIAQAIITFPGGQASLLMDGASRFGPEDRITVTGSEGSVTTRGPDFTTQEVSLVTRAGIAHPVIEGTQFREGFIGCMGGLLRAVETDTVPLTDGRRNLDALALVFAAVASTRRGCPVVPGTVRSLAEAMG